MTTSGRAGSVPGDPGTVWAPRAELVELVVGRGDTAAVIALRPDGTRRGWWVGDGPLAPGTAYRFRIDGTTAPDPRSPWQPDGVDGPSVVVDHGAFAWTDAGWQAPPLRSGVIYELHVGTFTGAGTYAGVIERLDHLVDLGVTHVELMPLATFDGDRGWGYDGVALYAPHPAYGSPTELAALVDACHQRGLAVLLDLVLNHLGPVGNHLATFGPYSTDRYSTPWGWAVNLDGPGSDEVRRFLVDAALHWLRDLHLDGLRLDAVHELVDGGPRHLLEQLVDEVGELAAELDRPLVLIAENDTNDPRLVRDRAQGGFGLDAHWCDDLHHAVHTVVTGEGTGYYADYAAHLGVDVLEPALRQGYVYDGRWSPARDRTVGRSPDGVRGGQLVVALQNHDQVGNRARGERIGHLIRLAELQVAAALVLTSPFVPLVFQGEEWAASTPFPYFADHRDPELAAAVRDGRRAEFAAFGWRPEDVPDPEDPATFASAVLRWDEVDRSPHRDVLAWYRDLLALRRSRSDLLDDRPGGARVAVDASRRTVLVRRGALLVAANLGPQPLALDHPGPAVLLASRPPTADGPDRLLVPPTSVAVLEVGPDPGPSV